EGSGLGVVKSAAFRAALDVKRQRDRSPRQAEVADVPSPADAEPDAAEQAALLQRALQVLEPGERRPFEMYYLSGKARDRVAAELGLTLSSIRGRVHRSREKIRRALGGE